MLRELAEALDLLTARQPLVLVLEDLHWSDPSTLDLLAVLARRHDPARLLLIGTYRPPEVRRRAHPLPSVQQELQLHGHCVELPLTLLPEAAIAAYLATPLAGPVAGRPPGPPGAPAHRGESALYGGAGGVLADPGGAPGGGGGVGTGNSNGGVAHSVPDNVQQLIDMQFDGLSAEEQHVLAAASVAGVEFSAAGVAAGLAQEVEPVDDWCTALARRGQFLQTSGEQRWPDGTVAGAYRFVHALYQQVLYQRVSAAQRVRLHQRIGARLEAGHGTQAGDIAAELAMHFARGRDAHRAVQYLRQAGQRSVERSAYVEAVGHFTRALEVLKTLPATPERTQQELPLHIALGAALQITKGNAAPEVEHAYTQARVVSASGGDAGVGPGPGWSDSVLYATGTVAHGARPWGDPAAPGAPCPRPHARGRRALGPWIYVVRAWGIACGPPARGRRHCTLQARPAPCAGVPHGRRSGCWLPHLCRDDSLVAGVPGASPGPPPRGPGVGPRPGASL